MALTGKQYVLTAGGHEATIVEVGAGIRSYRVGGRDITAPYGEDELPPRGCGSTLVPWPNRLRDGRYSFDGRDFQLPINDHETRTANHGLARWHRWDAVDRTPSSVTLAIDVVPQSGWVFEVRVDVTYELSEDGLSVSGRAVNTGAGAVPFGAGWHPYFSVDGCPLEDVVVDVPAAQRLVMDSQQVPVGTEPVDGTPQDFRGGRALGSTRLDDGYTGLVAGAASVRTPAGGAELWWDDAFSYLQVFTPDDWAHGRPAIAVEPMTCAPDAFNSGAGLLRLEPGAEWRGRWGIRPLG